jgi:hypothetical protein
MREEARERIEVHFEVFAKWMRDRKNIEPELVIREGEVVSEILSQIQSDPEIGVLILGAGLDKKGPRPLWSPKCPKMQGRCQYLSRLCLGRLPKNSLS